MTDDQVEPDGRVELTLLDIAATETEEELTWHERALCAQTDRAECLEYALENDERFGIWGGLSERERRKLKRRAV